ncbi:mammalian STARD1-STARD15-like lipid-binding START domain protein, putative (macronuclear) [Tetrahymena thermophila SB210]|uniref:Mammalian STARD1-STARD15-like lipid-binding START domain protein, putative n=1 Tax=Tetrahymena thermophila (strain SB210) TaxID=312017 RepID=Q240M6_TETTS|nr:mammalian STARD1-STARD15-like lipid-binding START domain protein, putative [Tetrahymena thermophila SB210]EAS02239.1 mammalian STARD1-STARD15-like lipid-binding START domain protein, putative [Tetrahymena thermophila SB210]|eukprot:XP_001022484.1 mammalian STARD1-STARD15-like lipid-binding START domain protein, putative [Tetrahymena thermophila SB210]
MGQSQYSSIVDKAIDDAQLVKNSQENWNVLLKGKYFTLSAKPYNKTEKQILKLEGNIPAQVNQVVEYFFNNYESIKNNREQCEVFESLEVIDSDTKVTVFKLKPMQDGHRIESLNIIHKKKINQNQVLIVNAHLDDHPKMPKNSNITRIENIINGIFLKESNSTNTFMEGYFLNDPKVPIPPQLIPQLTQSFLQSYEKDVESILQKK